MPIYEYKCQQCGHTIEVFTSSSAPKVQFVTNCPQCGNLLKRQYSFHNHFTPTKSGKND